MTAEVKKVRTSQLRKKNLTNQITTSQSKARKRHLALSNPKSNSLFRLNMLRKKLS